MTKEHVAIARRSAPSLMKEGPPPAAGFTEREERQARRLLIVLVITAAFFGVQFAGAIWAESDALRAEALHLLTDVGALGMSFAAMRIAVRRPTARFTYGLRRVEPVAAIFNALLVMMAAALVIFEAIDNLSRVAGPHPDRMLKMAALGLLVNGIAAYLIHGAIGQHDGHDHDQDGHDQDHDAHDHGHPDHHRDARVHGDHAPDPPCEDLSHHHIAQQARVHGHGHSLNLRGAWLHFFGDALGSLAVLVAAVGIRNGLSPKADPIASVLVALILLVGAFRLLKDAILILLEASPPHLPVDEIRSIVLATDGVTAVHHLHVWTLGAGHEAISAHVQGRALDQRLAFRVERALRDRFHIEYVTIQVETDDQPCQSEPVEP